MGKNIKEIANFMTGTIASPSAVDIPEDAATYAKNIDPISEEGKLKGVKTNLLLIDSGLNDNFPCALSVAVRARIGGGILETITSPLKITCNDSQNLPFTIIVCAGL